MELKILMNYLLEILRIQYVFLIVVYEVIILVSKNKLLSLTKKGLEKRVQFREFEVKQRIRDDYPLITVIQHLANASEFQLKVSRIQLVLQHDSMEIDKFSYNPPNDVLDYEETKKITFSDMRPLKLDCDIRCDTTKLRQTILDYRHRDITMTLKGIIELKTKTTKIVQKVDKRVEIKAKKWD